MKNRFRRRKNRRDFLRTAALAAGMKTSLRAGPLRSRGANDRVGIGFIGVGGRGTSHIRTVEALIDQGERLEMVAVNDAYGPRLRAAAEKTGARPYRHYADLLADKEVDAVCIASPDRVHIPQALDAVRAGKDVYCEKPLGHWTQFSESRELFREVLKSGRVVQVGTQGTSSAIWEEVGQLIEKGTIGRPQQVQAGYYRSGDWGERMPIPDPNAKPGPDLDWEGFLGDAPRVPFSVERFFSWRMFLDYAGGPCTDLFPHVFTPFAKMLKAGFPSLVSTSGGIFLYDDYGREVPDTFNMCIDYPEKFTVVLVCTLANAFPTGPVIRGDEAAMTFDVANWEEGCSNVQLHPAKEDGAGKVHQIELRSRQVGSTQEHWRDFLRCVRERSKPRSDIEFGFHVQTVLCMAMIGFLEKKIARFDPVKEEIVL